MHVVSKEVFIAPKNDCGVFPGFIKYISNDKPILMHRHGWTQASDTYDEFSDAISTDNGKTFSPSVPALNSTPDATGADRYAENAAFFDKQTSLLHTITSCSHYAKDHSISRNNWSLQFNTYNPQTNQWATPRRSNMGFDSGIMLSFSVPIETTAGTILLPAQKSIVDEHGQPIFCPGYWAPLLESLVLRGVRQNDGSIQWTPGGRVTVDPSLSSRGICEPAITQLSDGSLLMICRGDNGFFPEKPGYKWTSRSLDEGLTWSTPTPLTLVDGSNIESGASGSAIFRSFTNNKLYWLGNLALNGQRAKAHWPRDPLTLAEVQEEPLGLKPETFLSVDAIAPGEFERIQISNFRYYQDRENGQLVIFLTRFSENDPKNFKNANYYRYRVQLDA